MDKFYEKAKEALKGKVKSKILIYIISVAAPFLLLLFLIIIIIMMFLSPVTQALEKIDSFRSFVSVFVEKTKNFFSGRGFKEINMTEVELKEDEFNNKVAELYNYYYYTGGVEVDAPLILATVYYPLEISYDEDVVACVNGLDTADSKCASDEEQYDLWKKKIEKVPDLFEHSISEVITTYSCEAVTTTGSDGKSHTHYVQGGQVGDPEIVYPFDGSFEEDEHCTSSSNIQKYDYRQEPEKYDEYIANPDDGYIVESKEYNFPTNITDLDEKKERLRQIVFSIHDLSELYYYLFDTPAAVAQNVYGAIPYNILKSMVLPVDPSTGSNGKGSYIITSCFSPYRELSNGQKRPHEGIDLVSATSDLNIRAAAKGTVLKAVGSFPPSFNCYSGGCNGNGAGNYVVIIHEIDGIEFRTLYMHLSSVSVTGGQEVEAGEIIGVMGNTGNSSGTHLHFQYEDANQNPLNPGNLFTNPKSISDSAGCAVMAVDCANRNSPVAISPTYGKWGNATYAINVTVNGLSPIPLEQYILGVTINEMGGSFNVEALKAQMVAARTYTFGSQRFKSFTLMEAQKQIVIDMGVASEATQTFNLNGLCSSSAESQSKLISALEGSRGQVLVADSTGKMFSSEYSSYAANDGYRTLGSGYVCKLPKPSTGCENVASYATSNNCNQNGRNICGHGRGMSQWGANKMANNLGYNYSSILTHFYYASINDLSNLNLSQYEK
jgi:murein DD-endopeptidase MepM/ murein hydrolase activator NlpD